MTNADPSSARLGRRSWRHVLMSRSWLLVVLLVATVAVLGVVGFQLTARSIHDLVDAGNVAAAESTAAIVRTELTARVDQASAWAEHPDLLEAIANADEDAVRERLRPLVLAVPEFQRAFVADAHGDAWVSEPPFPESVDRSFADTAWYRAVHEDARSYVSDLFQEEDGDRRWVVSVATPLYLEGELLGTLVIQEAVELVQARVRLRGFAAHGELVVLNPSGGLAVHPSVDVDLREMPEYGEIAAEHVASEPGRTVTFQYEDPWSGRHLVAAVTTVEVTGRAWVVVAQQDVALAYAPVRRLAWQIASATALVGVASIFMGLVFFRQRAEVESRELEVLNVRELVPDSLITADAAGNVSWFNARAEETFGHRSEQIVGRPIAHLMPERFRLAHTRGLARYRETREARLVGRGPVELTGLRADGTEFPIELSLTSWNTPAGEPAYMAVIRDVTKRKAAEDALRMSKEAMRLASARAEQATQAKSQFLANMSHEIRTPMNGIIGMIELLLDTPLTERQREYLETVNRSADTLQHLLNDVLDLSKIEAGALELEQIDFSLREILGDTLQTLAARAASKSLELAYEIPPEVPDPLVGDPNRLRQIMVNLVGNAIKFTDRGEVVVRIGVDSDDDEGCVLRFTVRDTGPGIPVEQQTRIFEAFRQADATIARRHGGTGLGLTIASNLVQQMGGRIWVDSEVGRGSTFGFTARFEHAAAESRPLAEVQAGLRDTRVLVVDDNATNREILEHLLVSWQMRSTSVSDAEQGLAALQAAAATDDPFQLVLLDSVLPGMRGIDLVECMRGDPSLRETPVILLSSAGQPIDNERARALGVHRILTKPAKPSKLLRAIMQAVRTDAEEVESPPATVPSIQPRRILVAEDDPINQRVVTDMLTNRGHEVVIASTGQLALEQLVEQHAEFDLVLMDVRMPEMSGLEATRRLRAHEQGTLGPTAHLPVIAMTAHAMAGDREACLEAGMDDYLAKPVRAKLLYAMVEKFPVVRAKPESAAAHEGVEPRRTGTT